MISRKAQTGLKRCCQRASRYALSTHELWVSKLRRISRFAYKSAYHLFSDILPVESGRVIFVANHHKYQTRKYLASAEWRLLCSGRTVTTYMSSFGMPSTNVHIKFKK